MGGEKYNDFVEINTKFKSDKNINSCVTSLCGAIIQLPRRNRATLARIAEMCHKLGKDNPQVTKILADKFSPVMFSAAYPEMVIEEPKDDAEINEVAEIENEKKKGFFHRSKEVTISHHELVVADGDHLEYIFTVFVQNYPACEKIFEENPIPKKIKIFVPIF